MQAVALAALQCIARSLLYCFFNFQCRKGILSLILNVTIPYSCLYVASFNYSDCPT